MKQTLSLLFVSSFLVLAACGGATAERAKDDIKGAGSDISNGVGASNKGLDDGIGTNKPDGGGNSSDKK